MATFASRLAQLRKEAKLTQHQLADKLMISYGSIGNYEAGKRFPRYEDLEAIADYFNIELDYLCGRTDKRPDCTQPLGTTSVKRLTQCVKQTDCPESESTV